MLNHRWLRSHFVFGCSVLAISGLPVQAQAACAPDPTANNGTTYCTDVDANGLSVPTTNTQVQVATDARVLSGGNPAAIIISGPSTLRLQGIVDGGAATGLLVTNGVPYYGYNDPYAGASSNGGFGYGLILPSNRADVYVAAGATLTGIEAIRLDKRSDNPSGTVTIYFENQGSINGTGGTAIVAAANTTIQFSNGQSGKIGAISGRISTAVNAGLIDGGALSAISNADTPYILNSGMITSSSNSATLSFISGNIINEGTSTIRNLGNGLAIDTSGALSITNRAGATISTAGGVAIRTASTLYLENKGTITGSIDAHADLLSKTEPGSPISHTETLLNC